MLEYILGIITGFLFSILLLLLAIYLRKPIQSTSEKVERKISGLSISQKGAIFFPEKDGKIEREKIIKKNAEHGADTPISDLQ